MTDLAASPSAAARPRGRARRLPRPLVLYGCAFAAAGAGLALGHAAAAEPSSFEGSLVLLLRFMAAMKAAMVLGALALTHWRIGRPLAASAFAGYLTALALMAAAPGLIWGLGLIGTGAGLFHAGLLGFLVLAWRDDGVAERLKTSGRRR